MVYEIDLIGVESAAALHARIREILPVPEWYGNNLDALYDVLTEPRTWDVVFKNMNELRAAVPKYTAVLERLCEECGVKILDET